MNYYGVDPDRIIFTTLLKEDEGVSCATRRHVGWLLIVLCAQLSHKKRDEKYLAQHADR